MQATSAAKGTNHNVAEAFQRNVEFFFELHFKPESGQHVGPEIRAAAAALKDCVLQKGFKAGDSFNEQTIQKRYASLLRRMSDGTLSKLDLKEAYRLMSVDKEDLGIISRGGFKELSEKYTSRAPQYAVIAAFTAVFKNQSFPKTLKEGAKDKFNGEERTVRDLRAADKYDVAGRRL